MLTKGQRLAMIGLYGSFLILMAWMGYHGYLHRCTWMCDSRHHCNAICYLNQHTWGMPK